MDNRKHKLTETLLFVLTTAAGLAVFVTAWNTFLQGKGKIYISLGFLFIFLLGMLFLYFHFLRLHSLLKNQIPDENSSKIESVKGKKSDHFENLSGREDSFNLLSGVFGKPDLKKIGEKILRNLAREYEIVQGIFYFLDPEINSFTFKASYALSYDKTPADFKPGEGINGQAVADNKVIVIPNIPESYSDVVSGLGRSKATYLYIVPLVYNKKSIAVLEISCFKDIGDEGISTLNQLMRDGGSKLNAVLYPEAK